MDSIIIENLEIYAYHGVNPEENFLGQKFIVSVQLFTSLRYAGKSDDLEQSINYGEVCHFIEKEFQGQKHLLIESCVETLAESILNQYPIVEKVDVLLKKPWAPIGSHLDYAGVKITRSRHKVFIGLGSNMGNKEENIQKAIEMLNTNEMQIKKVSSHYVTKPWGNVNQDDFINCVAEMTTLLTPEELLNKLQEIEKILKRNREEHWGPRTIDLDILLYDDIITESENLAIPHPYLEKRLFVLTPLAEIAPWTVHPLSKKRIFELNEELKKTEML